MFCTHCGAQNPDEAKFCFSCGSTLAAGTPAASPPVSEVSPPPAALPSPIMLAALRVEYAGFWRRFLALIIDRLILGIPTALLVMMFVVPAIMSGVSSFSSGDNAAACVSFFLTFIAGWIWLVILVALLHVFYWTLFECSRFQATPGKMALGIIVTDVRSNRITLARSLGRNLGKIISSMILHIGFLMAGLTEKKQGLHDMLADCLVVMKHPTQY
jgi:uncharacterized RDD family membrane protein YckC